MNKLTVDQVKDAIQALTFEERQMILQELSIETQQMDASLENKWLQKCEQQLVEPEIENIVFSITIQPPYAGNPN